MTTTCSGILCLPVLLQNNAFGWVDSWRLGERFLAFRFRVTLQKQSNLTVRPITNFKINAGHNNRNLHNANLNENQAGRMVRFYFVWIYHSEVQLSEK